MYAANRAKKAGLKVFTPADVDRVPAVIDFIQPSLKNLGEYTVWEHFIQGGFPWLKPRL